ncbi:hypothetical protein AVEN_229824-1 [Araneus ventricosus]|uniref:Tc1-like transposase DDE domain-containing protein n=1 Tax=Araneus ventricosus TaxID=182803 RepID=A0A4Y2LMP8_ARAVE|nr:hypothetical protein AVEN_229824-1 [Araneus ventricosus]
MVYSAHATQKHIDSFGSEQMTDSPYSPDLASSDFHLVLSGQHFDNHAEVKDAVTSWLNSPAATSINPGIQNLVSRYAKNRHVLGD